MGSKSIPSNKEYKLNLSSSSDKLRKESKTTKNSTADIINNKDQATQVNLDIIRQDVGFNSDDHETKQRQQEFMEQSQGKSTSPFDYLLKKEVNSDPNETRKLKCVVLDLE